MRNLLTSILLALVACTGWAQERSLRVSTDREEILIGEQIQMTLELRSASSDTALLPAIGDTLRREVEVLSRSKVDTTYEGPQLDQKILRQSFVITSFDSGYFPVEPLIGQVNGSPIASEPFLVSVQTVKIDTAQGMIDIKDIEQVPFAWKEWFEKNWHWFAIGILVAALITWLALLLSKEKEVVEKKIVVPTRPAHEIALERLEHMRKEELWQQGKIKEYYSELTDILREFIELRFAIPALEQTTDEIVTAMKRFPDFSDEERTTIQRLLFLADLVKFAKEKPVGQENEGHFITVNRFVKAFIPQEKDTPLENTDEGNG
ncbi:MAG: hypothetical protein HQ500_08710 [Flavobacteriales bacterium]|nr:hypothetical protein [Flavobacteriales bacterium]